MSDFKNISVQELCKEYPYLDVYIHRLQEKIKHYEEGTSTVYSPNKPSYKELVEKLSKSDDLRKKDIDELWETRIVPLQNQVKEKDNLLDVANHKSQCQDSRIKQLQQIIKNLETRIDFAVGYISATQPHTDKHPMEVKRWLFEGFERMKDEI